MTNEEKASEIVIKIQNSSSLDYDSRRTKYMYDSAMEMAQWKDEQPIMETGGWHTEQPTENVWYLVDTPDFPKNCECVVAEWDNDAKHFYDEHSDCPIKFHRWKLIERG